MDDSSMDRRDRYAKGQAIRKQNVDSREFSDERYDGNRTDEEEFDDSIQEFEHENSYRNTDRRRKLGKPSRFDSDEITSDRNDDYNTSYKNHSRYTTDGYDDENVTFEKKGQGPDVVVTMADVHLSADELEDLDKVESHPNQFRHGYQGAGGLGRENRSRSHDKIADRSYSNRNEGQGHLKKETRRYQSQSQQNLTNHTGGQESRPRVRHHYTPNLVRKGKDYSYELPVDIDLEGEDAEGYDYYGEMVKVPKATSVADVSRTGQGGQFTMPASKMGSFQDFGPIKHSTSTLRVSSSKGKLSYELVIRIMFDC